MFTVINIDSFDDFIEEINSFSLLKNDIRLFRGQRDLSWKLESGLFRKLRNDNLIKSFYEVEMIELNEFFEKSENLKWNKLTVMQKLCVAQHYKVNTRLLDWTESIEVALYFAFEKAVENKNGRVIYSILIDSNDVLPSNYVDFPGNRLIKFINPQLFLSDHRIMNQKSWFSTQAIRIKPIDKLFLGDRLPHFDKMGLIEDDPYFDFKIKKFVLQEKFRDEVLDFLSNQSIDKRFIYPTK
jgi:hypothetical protein